MIKNKNIQIEKNYFGKEPEFLMKVGFEEIDSYLISIAHRRLSNRSSGVLRHTGNPRGERVIEERTISDAFFEGKKDARIYHDKIEEHIEGIKIKKDGEEFELRGSGKNFFLISNGNLGNNFWHVAWQRGFDRALYCLRHEPVFEREYSCFVVPKIGNPRIQRVRFNDLEFLLDENGKYISDEINWVNYGQQILRHGKIVPIKEIIDQFYDIKHVFNLRDWAKKRDEESEERMRKDIQKMKDMYWNYPQSFGDNMLAELGELERSEYYHNVLGVNLDSLFVYHSYGKPEDIAEKLVDRGVRDAIILDNGGSVGCYSSWLYPDGGWLNTGKRFRPERISYLGFVLK